ncbi:MAG: hypothetical protein R2932_37975 [Caldilineaceae bacterium]
MFEEDAQLLSLPPSRGDVDSAKASAAVQQAVGADAVAMSEQIGELEAMEVVGITLLLNLLLVKPLPRKLL